MCVPNSIEINYSRSINVPAPYVNGCDWLVPDSKDEKRLEEKHSLRRRKNDRKYSSAKETNALEKNFRGCFYSYCPDKRCRDICSNIRIKTFSCFSNTCGNIHLGNHHTW